MKIHSQQEKRKIRGNFKTSEGTQFDCVGVRTHISMYILVIYFAICYCTYINVYILIYIDVCYCTYKYIYIKRLCVKVNAHSVSEQLRESKSLY